MSRQDRHDDLNVTWTAVVGFVGAILIFVFIVAVQVMFHRTEQAQYRQKVVDMVPQELAQLRADQMAKIHAYRIVDEKRGLVAIPVAQAMAALVRDPVRSMKAIREAASTTPAPISTTQSGGTSVATAPGTTLPTVSRPAAEIDGSPGGPRP